MNAATRDKVDHALEQTGVLDLAERPLHTLSGGQLQRALFARVIMQDAPLIILDEPFAAVDQNTEQHLLRIIDGGRNNLVRFFWWSMICQPCSIIARTHFCSGIGLRNLDLSWTYCLMTVLAIRDTWQQDRRLG